MMKTDDEKQSMIDTIVGFLQIKGFSTIESLSVLKVVEQRIKQIEVTNIRGNGNLKLITNPKPPLKHIRNVVKFPGMNEEP